MLEASEQFYRQQGMIDAAEKVRDLHKKYGDIQPPTQPNINQLALRISDELDFLGVTARTSDAIEEAIKNGQLNIDSFLDLEEISDNYFLNNVPGVGKASVRELRLKLSLRAEPDLVEPVISVLNEDSRLKRQERIQNVRQALLPLKLRKPVYSALVRSANYNRDLDSLEDFIKMSDNEFLALPRFGEKSLQEFREAVDRQAEEAKQP